MDGYLSGGFEGGLAYAKSSIENSGFDRDVIESEGLADGTSGVRVVLGVRGLVALGPAWSLDTGLRAYYGGSLIGIFYLGTQFRF